MSYAMSYMIKLGLVNTGLSLKVDLYDYTNTIAQSGITSFIYPRGDGEYFWYYPSFPNNFRGFAQVYTSGSYMTSVAINPEDGEYLDSRVSNIGDSLGGGSLTFNVYARDNAGDSVGYTTIEIRPSGQSSLVALGFASTYDGKATFNLSSGIYSVYLYNAGVASWNNPYYVPVSVDGTSFYASGIRTTRIEYPDPTMTRIYVYVNDLGLEPQEDVNMKIYPINSEQDDDTGLFIKSPINVRSDADGYLYYDVAGNQEIKVVVGQANYEKTFTTPPSGVINILEA